jgi:hypothetical protein
LREHVVHIDVVPSDVVFGAVERAAVGLVDGGKLRLPLRREDGEP